MNAYSLSLGVSMILTDTAYYYFGITVYYKHRTAAG